jgi:outer membrane protein
MKSIKCILIFLGLIFLINPVYAADYKIGYVDLAKILNESPAAKAAQKKLEQEFTPRNKKLAVKAKQIKKQKEKLQKESEIMSSDQIDALQRKIMKGERVLKRDATEAQEDFKLRRRDELGKIENKLKAVILGIAESENYDLILTNADVTYASDKSNVNITAKVLKKFNAK